MSRQLVNGISPRAPGLDMISALYLRPALLFNRRCFSTTTFVSGSTAKRSSPTRDARRSPLRKTMPASPSSEHVLDPATKERFLLHVGSGQAKRAFDMINKEIGPRQLDKSMTAALLRCLHHVIRKRRPGQHKDHDADMVKSARDWYMARELAGSPPATQSLLGCYRDLGKLQDAASFWDWARGQRSAARPEEFSAHEMYSSSGSQVAATYTSLRVYGMALPILAAAGRGLDKTEQMYVEGLRRHAVAFNEYHLSPTAWQPEPEMPTTVPGASTTMLEGLMAARFIYGKVVPGYICLDTIFKLHPTQIPSAVFHGLCAERPLPEQVQALCMAAKGGNFPSPIYMKNLLSDLCGYSASLPPGKQMSDIFESMLTLIRLIIATRPRAMPLEQAIDKGIPRYLLESLLSTLPTQADNQTQLRAIVVAFELQALFTTIGIEPSKSVFSKVASQHDSRHRKLLALSIAMTPPTATLTAEKFWTFLEANAALGLFNSIEAAWAVHGENRAHDRDSLMKLAKILAESAVAATEKDRNTIHASKVSSEIDEAHREILRSAASEVTSDPEELRNVTNSLMSEFNKHLILNPGQLKSTDSDYTNLLDRIEDCVTTLAGLIKDGHVADLHHYPIDRVSILPTKRVSQEWEQELYSKLVLGKPGSEFSHQIVTAKLAKPVERLETTAQTTPAEQKRATQKVESIDQAEPTEQTKSTEQVAADGQAEMAGNIGPTDTTPQGGAMGGEESASNWQTMQINHTATTSISLAELRFQNWCDMNYLILEAQAFEDLYNEHVERKAANGEQIVHFKTLHMVHPRDGRPDKRAQQMDMYWEAQHRIAPILENKDMWFATIERLRTGPAVLTGLEDSS